MSWILGNPKFQAIYNGDSVSGGTLYFYTVGTTTGKSAFPTIADAAAGTNGFTSKLLDAQGQPTSTDMFVMNGAYKLVLKDSAGATLWTVDNVEGQDDIFDSNGNEVLKFVSVADAYNELTVTNAATGGGPILSTTGTDSDIDLNFQAKGAGEYNFKSTSSQSAEVRLFEDTDNGTNYLGFKPPAALTASTTFTMPDGDGGANTFKITNGSGTLSWSTLTGVAATQAEMETATSTIAPVTPGRVQYHPGVAKIWIKGSYSGGAPTIVTDYGVTSLTDVGTGNIDIAFDTAFSSANYIPLGSANHTGSADGGTITGFTDQLAGSINLILEINGDVGTNNVLSDTGPWFAAFFGDQ